jgi:hypothetical protein
VKIIYLPVYRIAASYVVSYGRRWSVLEHLLLLELSKGRRQLTELAAAAMVPERLIVEALINLLRANWIEVRSGDAVYFQATKVGKFRGESDSLPPQVVRDARWISLCVDRLTGAWLRTDDLNLIYDKDLPEEAHKLEPTLQTYDPSDSRLRDLLYLSSDEVLEPDAPQFRQQPSRPYARVGISFGDIDQGLPPNIPLALRSAILEQAEKVPEIENASESIQLTKGRDVLKETLTLDNLIVGGSEHFEMLRNALETARSIFLLHSCFLDAPTVRKLLPEFEKAAKRKVKINLIWGLTFDVEDKTAGNALTEVSSVLGELSPAAKDYIQLSPLSSGSHAKLIIYDRSDGSWCSIVSSCNFLSTLFSAIDISLRINNATFAAYLVGLMVETQLPASGAWSPFAIRLNRIWNQIRTASEGATESGTHEITLLLDEDHYACVRESRDRAAKDIVIGCDLFGLAAETSVLTPMQRAAELGKNVRLFYRRPSKFLKASGGVPDAKALEARGMSLEHCDSLHAKFLAWDDDNLAVTSFNWMATVAEGSRLKGAEVGLWAKGPGLRAMLAEKLLEVSGGKLAIGAAVEATSTS